MIHIGGFTPWFYKYVDSHSQHQHGGVATEWESVKVNYYRYRVVAKTPLLVHVHIQMYIYKCTSESQSTLKCKEKHKSADPQHNSMMSYCYSPKLVQIYAHYWRVESAHAKLEARRPLWYNVHVCILASQTYKHI